MREYFMPGLVKKLSSKLIMMMVLILMQSAPVAAQYATVGAFATRGFRGRTPLSVNYSLDMAPSMSMGVVTVNIADTAGPSKVDRQLTVVLYTKNWGQGSEAIAYRYQVELAEGLTKTQVEIPFPAVETQFAWDVGVFEDGRDVEDKRNRKYNNNINQQDYHWSYNFNQNSTLLSAAGLLATDVDPKTEARNLKAISDFIDSSATAAQAATIARGGAAPGTVYNANALIPVNKASGDWRHYFPYPVWIASVDALAEIDEKQPQVAAALRTYVSAGGTLLVYEVNVSQSISSVNRLLSSSGGNAELASWKSIGKTAPAWWIIDSPPTLGGVSSSSPSNVPASAASSEAQTIEGAGAAYDAALLTDTLLETGLGSHRDNLNDLMSVLGFEDVTLKQLEAGRLRLLSALSSDKMLGREYGRGRVVICSKALHELTPHQISSIGDTKAEQTLCVLTAKSHDGSWFWQNLIIEVGKPPVWVFCGLVTLFGALLGPGLLLFTGRMQRRSLMIFLVPAVSLVATLAIVLYGVLHEGFETHVRIHSVTAYDDPAQVAFAWSRQNYFSGLPPREGLQFPADAYVRPVAPDDAGNYSGTPDPRRNLTGTVSVGEKQTWNDWLKPRQHQQLLVGHKVDPRTIPISTARNAAGKLVLKNLTKMRLPLVVLRGDKDDYYFEADLGPNESREPETQDRDSVAVAVSKIGVDFKPKIPPELDGGSDSLLNFGNPRRYARSYNVQASEIINDAFKRYMSDDLELEPHGFATLVPEFGAIEIPLKGIQSDNVNLVIGVDSW